MERIEIPEKYIKNNYKKFNASQASESRIYFSNNTIIKILNEDYRLEREEIVGILSENNFKHCTKIDKMIYENGKFYGYTMPYYKKYTLLSDVSHLSLNQRKLFSHQLLNTHKDIVDKLGIYYYDYHDKNVLVKNNNIRLLDMDSCLPDNEDYPYTSITYLFQLISYLLYDVACDDIEMICLASDGYIKIMQYLYDNINIDNQHDIDYDKINSLIDEVKNEDVKTLKKQYAEFIK